MRDAYRRLLGDADPARAHLEGAVDLRPSGTQDSASDRGAVPRAIPAKILISGPDDLQELRAVLEDITGSCTWPFAPGDPDAPGTLRLTDTVVAESRAAVLTFVAALGDQMDDRAGAWRTWRTVVESVDAALSPDLRLTFDALVVSGPTRVG